MTMEKFAWLLWVRLAIGCIAWFMLTTKINVELSAYRKRIRDNLTIMSRKLIRPTDKEDTQITTAALDPLKAEKKNR